MSYEENDVIAALENICESEVFRSSPRAREFLRYVVTETIEGRGDQLNGTTIAQDVYKKDADFDPGQDTLIRVGARRLRSMLRDYYIDYPDNDAVTLSMPKGGYNIVVERNQTTGVSPVASDAPTSGPPPYEARELTPPKPLTSDAKSPTRRKPIISALAAAALVSVLGFGMSETLVSDRDLRATPGQPVPEDVQAVTGQDKLAVSDYPLIAVRPFKNQTGEKHYDFLEDSLQSILVEDLSRFQLVRPVMYDEVYETLPKIGEANSGPYRYAISGEVLSVEPELNLSIKLVDLDTGSVLSEQEIRRSPETSEYFNDLSKIVTDLSGEFAGLGGVIPRENLNHIEAQISHGTMILSDLSQFECLTLTDKFQYDPQKTPAKFRAVYTCLSESLQDNPDDPLLLAYLGSLTLWATKSNPKYHRARSFNPDINSQDGFDMVKRAAEIGPDIGNVQYFYSATLRMNGGSLDDILKHAELARKANPGNPLYMYWLSQSLADVGDWDQALSLAQEARARTPSPPPNYYIPDFARALRYDDKEGMQKFASIIAERGYNYGYLFEYLAAAANDDERGMAKHRATIDREDTRQREKGNDGIMFVLRAKLRNPEVVSKARELFNKAGVIKSTSN